MGVDEDETGVDEENCLLEARREVVLHGIMASWHHWVDGMGRVCKGGAISAFAGGKTGSHRSHGAGDVGQGHSPLGA